MAMGTRKIGPAVAAGCTMVVKPAKQTPLSMLALAEILRAGGLAGRRAERDHKLVVGLGDGAADPRPAHAQALVHRLDRGRQAADRAGRRAGAARVDGARRQRSVPRLRGRRPRRRGRRRDDRQDAQHRRGVHGRQPFPRRRPAGGRVRRRLAERMGAMKVGRGTEDGVEVGPLIDEHSAREGGGARRGRGSPRAPRPWSAARRVEGRGYFYEPTVLSGVPDGARVLEEEIFGPVAPIGTFDAEEDAIAAANATEYGLVAYVFTRDVKRALRVCEGLEIGMVGLNQGMVSNPAAPFGGVKQSGFGREGGREGIDEYLETKYVAVNL